MDRQEIGTLVIVVLKARNLHDKYFWKQDAFAQVGLNGETKRTKVDVKGGQHPEWDEEIRVPVMKNASEKHRKLEVSCWAKSPSKEENIGTGKVDLAETLKTGEFDDWVPLDINGVARGEVYLEMTFFSHAPAPSGLMVPKTNLQRRPSKLSPADRLSRPVATKEHLPPVQERLPPVQQKNEQLAAPTRTSPGRGGRESPLPPIPDHSPASVPSALMPGRPNHHGTQPQQQGSQLKPQAGVTHVPSILRPRNPKSSPTPIHGPPVEYNGVVPPQGQTYGSGSPPRTYTPVVPPPQSPYEDGPARYVSPPPPQWGGTSDTSGGFSFPVPALAGARESSLEYPPPAGYPPPGPERHGSNGGPAPAPSFSPPPAPYQPPHSPFQQQSYPPQQPTFGQQQPSQFQPYPPHGQSPYSPINTFQQSPPPTNNGSNLPDPYLLARYQTPLPLPPDSPTSRNAPASKVESNPDNVRFQAMRQADEEAARRKEKEREDRERREREDREREEQERREREDKERREREDRERREREERERREREERERREREDRERREREQREREEQERRAEEEAARRKAEEEERIRTEEAARRKREEEDAARRKAQEEKRRAEEEAARRKAQEQREREQKERERILRQAEEQAARRREQERKDRELAQQMADETKRAEEEAARRKEQERKDRELAQQVYDEAMQQEERDRELARQLDRELNLQEGGGNMPGRW